MVSSPLLTHEAAKIFKLSPERFRQLVREGRVPVAATMECGTRLFERSVIEEAARRRSQEAR